MNLSSLAKRSISGLIYIAIIIASILIGGYALYLLSLLFTVLGMVELYKITHDSLDRRYQLGPLLLDIAGALCLTWSVSLVTIPIFLFILLLRFILQIYSDSENPLKNIAMSVFSQLYIGGCLGCMLWIADMTSAIALLPIFILIWLNDTGAYLIGSAFGRHRLFERISPQKSWEGFLGGMIFNIIASIIFSCLFSNSFNISDNIFIWIGLGVLVTVFSTWGDLFESLLKRNLHIKDSGNLIPGHGGILDRIDSLLFVMPAVLIYFFIVLN